MTAVDILPPQAVLLLFTAKTRVQMLVDKMLCHAHRTHRALNWKEERKKKKQKMHMEKPLAS